MSREGSQRAYHGARRRRSDLVSSSGGNGIGMSVVTKPPLSRLTTARGDAAHVGEVGSDSIRNLLRAGIIRFVIADVGAPLRWVSETERFDFWKNEVEPHLAEPEQRVYLGRFPGACAYFASLWDAG